MKRSDAIRHLQFLLDGKRRVLARMVAGDWEGAHPKREHVERDIATFEYALGALRENQELEAVSRG